MGLIDITRHTVWGSPQCLQNLTRLSRCQANRGICAVEALQLSKDINRARHLPSTMFEKQAGQRSAISVVH